MADNNWTYSVSDVGEDGASDTSNDPDPPSESDDEMDLNDVFMLPLTVLGAYALVEYGVVLSAFETLFGVSGVATALTTAFAFIGGISLVMFSFAGTVGVTLLLAGVYYREAPLVAAGTVLSGLIAASVLGGYVVFTGLPLFVGAILSANIILYSGLLIKDVIELMIGFTLP